MRRFVCDALAVIGLTKTICGSRSECSAVNESGSPSTTELTASGIRMAVANRGARYTTVTWPSLTARPATCGRTMGTLALAGQYAHIPAITTFQLFIYGLLL